MAFRSSKLSAGSCDTFDELFLEDHVDHDHGNDRQDGRSHHCGIIKANSAVKIPRETMEDLVKGIMILRNF